MGWCATRRRSAGVARAPTQGRGAHRQILRCFLAGKERFGFRLVHYSVQSTHLHLVCEAKHRAALSRGMQGLLIRLAKGLNKAWGRKGAVWAEQVVAEPHTWLLRKGWRRCGLIRTDEVPAGLRRSPSRPIVGSRSRRG